VVTLRLPPLRERREDIPVLSRFFLERFADEMKRESKTLTRKAAATLLAYPWPGNVRELENVLKNAFILGDQAKIGPADLHLAAGRRAAAAPAAESLSLSAVEEENIRKVLQVAGNNKAEAARLLGIGRMTLYRKLKKYGLE
jgi:DNA-binding NtrC family response regulator